MKPRMRRSVMGLLLCCASLFTGAASAADRADTIFYGLAGGLGAAFPDDAQVGRGPKPGVLWEVAFGWSLGSHWALAVDFGTWQTELLGVPYHYHNGFTPRVEWAPGGDGGLVLAMAAGLGTTDGVVPPKVARRGLAVTPRLGYRFDLGRGAALMPSLTAYTHRYTSGGGTLVPGLVVELRLYGTTREP